MSEEQSKQQQEFEAFLEEYPGALDHFLRKLTIARHDYEATGKDLRNFDLDRAVEAAKGETLIELAEDLENKMYQSEQVFLDEIAKHARDIVAKENEEYITIREQREAAEAAILQKFSPIIRSGKSFIAAGEEQGLDKESIEWWKGNILERGERVYKDLTREIPRRFDAYTGEAMASGDGSVDLAAIQQKVLESYAYTVSTLDGGEEEQYAFFEAVRELSAAELEIRQTTSILSPRQIEAALDALEREPDEEGVEALAQEIEGRDEPVAAGATPLEPEAVEFSFTQDEVEPSQADQVFADGMEIGEDAPRDMPEDTQTSEQSFSAAPVRVVEGGLLPERVEIIEAPAPEASPQGQAIQAAQGGVVPSAQKPEAQANVQENNREKALVDPVNQRLGLEALPEEGADFDAVLASVKRRQIQMGALLAEAGNRIDADVKGRENSEEKRVKRIKELNQKNATKRAEAKAEVEKITDEVAHNLIEALSEIEKEAQGTQPERAKANPPSNVTNIDSKKLREGEGIKLGKNVVSEAVFLKQAEGLVGNKNQDFDTVYIGSNSVSPRPKTTEELENLQRVKEVLGKQGVDVNFRAHDRALGLGLGTSSADIQTALTTLKPAQLDVSAGFTAATTDEGKQRAVEQTAYILQVAREAKRTGTQVVAHKVCAPEVANIPVADLLAAKGVQLMDNEGAPLRGPQGEENYYSQDQAEGRLQVWQEQGKTLPEELADYAPEPTGLARAHQQEKGR